MYGKRQGDQRQSPDLELQEARYEASLAEHRYAACDPNNLLIAAHLEKNWEIALRRAQELEARQPADSASMIELDPSIFANIAENLSAAWNAPDITMRTRQQLLRTTPSGHAGCNACGGANPRLPQGNRVWLTSLGA